MQLAPFLLDRWLDDHTSDSIAFNLGGSTGPLWTVGSVLDLEPGSRERLLREHVVYTPSAGTPGLREAVSRMTGAGIEHVVIVASASEALFHLFFAAAESGANVLVPFPGFPPYKAIPAALGIEVREYRLRRDAKYRVDFDEIERLVDTRTRLLLVNSPHNPTGAILREHEMRRLHDFAADRGIQFVSDEVFHPIYHGSAGASAASLPKATIIGDLSKALSLSGLRIGWIVERDEKRRADYLNARQYFTISNATIGEFAAEIAVRHCETIWARTREVAQANLRHVDALLQQRDCGLEWVRPEGGMTTFPRFVSGKNTRPFCEEAARQGLLLVPGDCFGVPEHFRLGFGVGAEWYPAAMERLGTLLRARVEPAARSTVRASIASEPRDRPAFAPEALRRGLAGAVA